MKYFLCFCGFPRSGHTLVAAILNANPNCMVSNQLNIFSQKKISLDYIKSYSLKPHTWKSTTQIKHVPKQEITIIGDKTGHRTTEILSNNPQRLGIIKSQVGVPLKWILVVRNPFDNLATWARLNYQNKNNEKNTIKKELNIVIEKYKKLNQTIDKLKKSEDILTVKHEDVITKMHNTLEEISNFLEISFDPQWRDYVRETVWKKPRITRAKIRWNQNQVKVVNDIISSYPWLKGYTMGGCGRC